jgi:hypothetical protein
MRRLLVSLIIFGTILLAGVPGPQGAVAAGRWTDCGKFGLQGDVLVHQVACSKGRRLVKAFLVRSQTQGSQLDVFGFSCSGRLGGSEFIINCSKGSQRVHWRGAIS